MHEEIGDLARRSGLDALYAVGELALRATHGFGAGAQHFASVEALVDALRAELAPGATILVKGSRFMRMERVVDAITEPKE